MDSADDAYSSLLEILNHKKAGKSELFTLIKTR